MKDPIDLPLRGLRTFVCINIVTGHIRSEKRMTAEMAIRINSFNHTQMTSYRWLWNDQNDFNDQLNYDTPITLTR